MSALSVALQRLQGIVGPGRLLTDTGALNQYPLDGQTPVAVALPGSGEEVVALLRAAAEANLSVLVRGAGHHLHLGAPPGPIGLVVCMTRLNQIVEYDPGDLTVTAQAGMSLSNLQQLVGERSQMLPLDPPGPPEATLGGIVAANLSGPMRMKYGAPRDLVLGMRVALASGELVKTGGKTVKNVAGYDLTKLFVGSLGTVGAILELTFRLVPAPERRAVTVATMAPEQMKEVAAQVALAPWEISACEVVNQAAAPKLRPYLPAGERRHAWVICVGLGGSPEAVERQAREISSLVAGGTLRFDGTDADRVWERVRALAFPSQTGSVLLRASVPITAVWDTLDLISSQPGWGAVAHAGDGIVYGAPVEEMDITASKKAMALIRRRCEEAGGFAVLESGPANLKRELGVWGEGLRNADLMQRLKVAYDPAGLLGCGRLV